MKRDICIRELRLRSESIDESARSVDAVMATEEPAEVFDWSTGGIVREVLVIDGGNHPAQVPLLEAHSRYSLDDVLGSVRDIRTENGQMVGTLFLAEGDERAERAWSKILQGHLTDVSIGYRVKAFEEVPPGKTRKINGKTYSADGVRLKVSTTWDLKELSLVPIGADSHAKIREEEAVSVRVSTGPEPGLSTKGSTMSDESRNTGAPETPEPQAEPRTEPIDSVDDLATQRLEAERTRQSRIRQMAGRDVPAVLVEQAINEGWTIDESADRFLVGMRGERRPAVQVVRDNQDSLREDLSNAIRMQVGQSPQDQRKIEAARKFKDVGLHDLARISLQMERQEVPVDKMRLFERAIGTGTFTNLLGDSATKTLQAAYESYPSTILRWAGTREVKDFKQYKDIKLSAFSSMPQVGNAGEISSGNLTEEYETMQLKTYGLRFAVTRQMWINDDLGAFMRTPVELGRLAGRNVDDIGYTLLISNSGVGPTMTEDSQALFYASRSTPNYQTGAATVLGDSSLSAGKTLMRKIKGLGGEHINVVPRTLLVPAALEHTALKLASSSEIMVASTGTTDATVYLPTKNVHQGTLQVVVEPRLDAGTNGSTAWYLAADPADVPSLVVVFLRGNRTPVVERHDPTDVLGIGWRMYHDIAVAAVDWRGILRSKGA